MNSQVLVCEDDRDLLRLTSRVIEKAGYEVVQAADGNEALEYLEGGAIQLAVLDWEVPGPNGIQVCRRLKNCRKCRTIYIIVLTSRDNVNDVAEALESGASDYVTKPFVDKELVARLGIGQRTVQMQAELAQAQKLESVGQLAAGIAHEINTPTQYVGDNIRFLQDAFGDICTVLGRFNELLKALKDGTVNESLVADVAKTLKEADVSYLVDEIPQAIEQSLDGVSRVAKIVRAMKEFSHPGTEEKSLVNLTEAIETTITVARNEWKYVADLVTEFSPRLPMVSCYPAELNQVFLNLLVNAAHAIADTLSEDAGEKGTITVATASRDDCVEVSVRDTGTGIPAEVRSRIFDPFFTTKEVGKGTGQGLAIARSVVVDKHGGAIECQSEEGVGTTFTVRLPISAQSQSPEAGEYASAVC